MLAQRLVRVICTRCKQTYTPSDELLTDVGIPLEMAKGKGFAHGRGCNYCQMKGYRGRIAIFELMLVNAKIRQLIFEGKSTQQIRETAITQGMTTLYNDGVTKAMNGVTSLEEVYRVAKRTEQDHL